MSKLINWDNILQKFRELWAALSPFTIHVGEGLLWFYEKVLLPVAGWAVGNLFPAVLSLITALVSSLDSILQSAMPMFTKLYEDFLVPVGTWVGDDIINALNWLGGALKTIGDWIAANPAFLDFFGKFLVLLGVMTAAIWAYNAAQSIMNLLMMANPVGLVVIAIAALVAALWWCVDNWELVKATAIAVWAEITRVWNEASAWFNTYVIQPLVSWFTRAWADIVAWATKAWADVSAAWNSAWTWFKTTVVDPISAIFRVVWAAIQKFVTDPLGTIYELWAKVEKWFQDTVIDPVSKAFEDAWASITGWVTGSWESIKTAWTNAKQWFQDTVITPISDVFRDLSNFIRGIINGVIGFVNTMIGGVESGINAIVGAINSIGFEIPPISVFGQVIWEGASVRPNLGTVSFGRVAELPMLAQGAVIPPNSKFAAILGDQKSGNNIEAPESLIRKIVREEAGRNRAQVPVIQFTGDLAGLARVLKPIIKMEDDRMGTPLTVGGDFL